MSTARSDATALLRFPVVEETHTYIHSHTHTHTHAHIRTHTRTHIIIIAIGIYAVREIDQERVDPSMLTWIFTCETARRSTALYSLWLKHRTWDVNACFILLLHCISIHTVFIFALHTSHSYDANNTIENHVACTQKRMWSHKEILYRWTSAHEPPREISPVE